MHPGSGWGSGSEGCCCPTQQSSLSPKTPSWNVSPACQLCALAVLTSCQSTHKKHQSEVSGGPRQSGADRQTDIYTDEFMFTAEDIQSSSPQDVHICKRVPVSIPGCWLMSCLQGDKRGNTSLSPTAARKVKDLLGSTRYVLNSGRNTCVINQYQ